MKRKWLLGIVVLFHFLMMNVVSVSAEEIDVIEEIEEAGTYFIEVATKEGTGNEIVKVVRMNVLFPKTVISIENQEGIDAHDITIEKNKITTLASDELIALAGAHAWSLVDGRKIPIKHIVLEKAVEKGVDYTITFSTEKGTSTTIKVYEVEQQVLGLGNSYINLQELQYTNIVYVSLFAVLLIVIPLIAMTVAYIYTRREIKNTRKFLYNK